MVALAAQRVPGAAEAVAAARQRRGRIEAVRVRARPIGACRPAARRSRPQRVACAKGEAAGKNACVRMRHVPVCHARPSAAREAHSCLRWGRCLCYTAPHPPFRPRTLPRCLQAPCTRSWPLGILWARCPSLLMGRTAATAARMTAAMKTGMQQASAPAWAAAAAAGAAAPSAGAARAPSGSARRTRAAAACAWAWAWAWVRQGAAAWAASSGHTLLVRPLCRCPWCQPHSPLTLLPA